MFDFKCFKELFIKAVMYMYMIMLQMFVCAYKPCAKDLGRQIEHAESVV